jgi:hypothetical protein
MCKANLLKTFAFLSVALLSNVVINQSELIAQGDLVRIDLSLSPLLTDAQSINYSTLEIGKQSGGVKLFDLVFENVTDQTVGNLFLDITISSSRRGVLADLYSQDFEPFELMPRQMVVGSNFSLDSGFPGIRYLNIEGGITPEGENLLNSLEGGTRLPDDIYTVTFSIYQGTNKRNGGRLLDTVSESFGGAPILNLVDFYLIQPGGPLGSFETITNRTPIFRWEGSSNINYRLLVVQDNGQNPQTLLQNAFSSEPISGPGATGSTLLEFEHIDVIVSGNSYQYPASGVKPLMDGNRYYWQLFALILTPAGVESRPSSIMEFSIPSSRTMIANFSIIDDIVNIVEEIDPSSGTELKQILADQFEITSITVDGVELTGAAYVTFLEELLQKIRTGQIVIIR